MGREKVLEWITKKYKKIIIGGAILFILGLLALLFFWMIYEELNTIMILATLWLIPGMLMVIIGARKKRNPMSTGCFKKNERLLEQADELFSNILYQDDFIIFSDRIIADAKDITQMVYIDDILWIYEWKQSYNMITAQHYLIIRTLSQTLNISIYCKSKAIQNELINRIYQLCPNSRVGYTKENEAYYKQIEQSHEIYMQ